MKEPAASGRKENRSQVSKLCINVQAWVEKDNGDIVRSDPEVLIRSFELGDFLTDYEFGYSIIDYAVSRDNVMIVINADRAILNEKE